MKLEAQASVDIARPRDGVFDAAVDPDKLPRILKKVGPIPAVNGIEMEGAGPLRAGTRRKVSMSDGSVMGEEVTVLDRPEAYRYHWLNPPAAPFNLLVRTAESDWKFSSKDGGTHIDWVYTFELTSPFVLPLAWPVIRLFRRWMVAGLAELRSMTQGGAP